MYLEKQKNIRRLTWKSTTEVWQMQYDDVYNLGLKGKIIK